MAEPVDEQRAPADAGTTAAPSLLVSPVAAAAAAAVGVRRADDAVSTHTAAVAPPLSGVKRVTSTSPTNATTGAVAVAAAAVGSEEDTTRMSPGMVAAMIAAYESSSSGSGSGEEEVEDGGRAAKRSRRGSTGTVAPPRRPQMTAAILAAAAAAEAGAEVEPELRRPAPAVRAPPPEPITDAARTHCAQVLARMLARPVAEAPRHAASPAAAAAVTPGALEAVARRLEAAVHDSMPGPPRWLTPYKDAIRAAATALQQYEPFRRALVHGRLAPADAAAALQRSFGVRYLLESYREMDDTTCGVDFGPRAGALFPSFIWQVLPFLPPATVACAARVNRSWRRACASPVAWHLLAVRDFSTMDIGSSSSTGAGRGGGSVTGAAADGPPYRENGESWAGCYRRHAQALREAAARAAAPRTLCRSCGSHDAVVRYLQRAMTIMKVAHCNACGTVHMLEVSTGDLPRMIGPWPS